MQLVSDIISTFNSISGILTFIVTSATVIFIYQQIKLQFCPVLIILKEYPTVAENEIQKEPIWVIKNIGNRIAYNIKVYKISLDDEDGLEKTEIRTCDIPCLVPGVFHKLYPLRKDDDKVTNFRIYYNLKLKKKKLYSTEYPIAYEQFTYDNQDGKFKPKLETKVQSKKISDLN